MGENRGPQVAGVAGGFLAVSWITVLLRCYCRLAVVKSFGADDYFAVLAQLAFTPFCAFAIAGVHYGTGQHAVDIHPATNIPIGLKWWWACEPAYVLTNMAMKFSIGIFLLRIAVERGQRITLYVVIVISTIMSAYFFLLFVFQCWPIAYFWGQYTGMEGHCIDPSITSKTSYAYSAVSCWSDWSFSILPAFMLRKLNMNRRTKVSVFMILALSAIASTATIIRMPYLGGLTDSADFLWATTDVAIWSLVESGLGITACCAATLRPLFRTFLAGSRGFGSYGKNTGQAYSANGWRSSNNPARGYHRKASRDTHEELELRNDVAKGSMVTTVVGGRGHGHDIEMGVQHKRGDGRDSYLKKPSGGWDGSQTNLNDASSVGSEDVALAGDWRSGFRTTTVKVESIHRGPKD